MAGEQILIVEDELIVADDIKRTMERLGYSVAAIVRSGEEAIHKADELQPDLVLMDIVLKGEMNGIEAAAKIGKLNIPVIYLTAYTDPETLELAKVTEPYGYLVKPFKERELRSAIEIALYKSKMEKKLKEREAWLFTTLKSIGDAVIASDLNGVIMFMNTVAEELTGWEEKDAIGRPLEEVFHIINEKTRKLCENPVEKILKTGKIVGLANHTALIAKDGTECIIADSGAPIRPDNDVITGVVLVFRDITAQRKMAEELHRMKKIEAVGLLAGGIAHDYNNIMTGILGNISLAKISLDDEEEAEKVADYLSEAEAACMRAKNLSGQLITFSKGGAPVKITISIAELIRESTSFFLHGSNVKCELSLPDNLWRADVDAGQINQVVNNLVMNADQAMPGGGTVWVAAKNIIVKEEDILPLKAGEYIKISIRDQGIGIPTTYLDKIFDPYFTTKQDGNGLGLASVYSIVKNHDGFITVDSTPGIGATFDVYLPGIKEEVGIEKEKLRPKGLRPGTGRILLMDDEEIVRNVTTAILTKLGYKVETAADGEKAIELYRKAGKGGKPFDAVILDLTIPGGMGGKETMEKLLAIDPQIKAIVSSGYSNDPIMADHKAFSFSGVVVKPFMLRELADVLVEVLR